MTTTPLQPELTRAVLDYLNITTSPSDDIAFIDSLIAAYIRRVPWESASRILKRSRETNTARCPRLPQEFWQDALAYGTGGTCFESNYAFLALLRALGFDGYLTINDVDYLRASHTALVITVAGSRWLVDVGYPLYMALPLDIIVVARREGPIHSYTVHSCGDLCFEIERDRHPKPYCFTLVDVPVCDSDYRAATAADYGRGGLFLDRVIITKVIDDAIWRFVGQDNNFELESFKHGTKTVHPLGSNIAQTLARIFEIDERILTEAIQIGAVAPVVLAC
ncbi:MAG: arylamine N-acetyltransferase [Anaerolineae bacterium]